MTVTASGSGAGPDRKPGQTPEKEKPMPRIVPLSEALTLDAGEQLPAIRGKVVKVGKYFQGESAKGPWSFQTITLEDGAVKADVKMKGRDQIPGTVVGKVMFAVANNGERGLTGVRAEEDEYQGKKSRLVLVTPSAEVTFGKGDWPVGETPATEPDRREEPPAESNRETEAASRETEAAPAETSHPVVPSAAKGWEAVKQDLNRIRKLHLLCCAAASNNVAALHKAGIPVGDEFLQSASATLFIEACKRGGVAAIPDAGEPPVAFPKFDF